MVKVILYICCSVDGFIADKDGGVAWLDEYGASDQDCGYKDFYNSINALVYGKNTYEQVLTFVPWPYPDKKSYIFGDKGVPTTDTDTVEFVHVDIPQFMKDIEAKGVRRLWLMGGAKLAESFYKLGLIDEYEIAVMPKKLGQGIPLLPEIMQGKGMELVKETTWHSGVVKGMVQKVYTRKSR
jgi:dihydrofolate reductase